MATILEAVAAILAANGHGTAGTDLFAGEMQDEPDVCRAVFESPGTRPVKMMGPGAYVVDRPRVRVVTRAGRDDYVTARDEAKAIRLLLDGTHDATFAGVYIHEIASMGGVEPLGKDSDDRPLFAVDFETWTAP